MKMKRRREKMAEESKFGSGLLIGSIIGAGAVFLLGTKKGKKLLKALTEEGFESISEISGVFDEIEDENGAVHKRISPKKVEKKIIKKVNQIKKSEPVKNALEKIDEVRDSEFVQNAQEHIEPVIEQVAGKAEDAVSNVSKTAKRFFKGIKRK